jgi:hypothetical protein
MQRWGFSTTGLFVFAAGVAFGMASAGNNTSAWPAFETGTVTHETRTESQTALPPPNVSEIPAQAETGLPQGSVSTRSSFLASWEKANGASSYLLDVSMDSSFRSYLDGYHNLDVGLVTGRVVTGLGPGTTYYYRVRPYNSSGRGNYSEVSSASTVATTGLTIHATFDSSITNDPNAAAIEAMINRCISIYESLFSDPITIQILFRYATTAPDGHPLRPGVTARSDNGVYHVPWSTYLAALRADAKTSNDNLANASLPTSALSTIVRPSSADGRAVGLDTPPGMFANGTVGNGGPYDGIVTLNSSAPFQFTRPITPSNFDAQRETEHEINEVMGLGSAASVSIFDPQDLFTWSSAGVRNITSNGTRYFSINGGVTKIVDLNQSAGMDFGDWLSTLCPQAHPYVQNASDCPGQSSDLAATSPEGIDLDVIGYDLVGAPQPVPDDFNNDGHPDYLLYNSSTRGTVIWYLNNNVLIGAASGPTLPAGWSVVAVADFNRDGHPDWLLFNPATGDTVIWYMNNNVHVTGVYGPTLPAGWSVVAVADFNRDGHPDWLLFNPATGDTVIWYMNNNVHVTGAYGPRVAAGWTVVGAADFNGDGKPDYVLYNSSTRQTVIWYMNNNVHGTAASGPTLPAGWNLVAP